MRLVFAGTPQVSVVSLEALLASRHEVLAVVTRPDAVAGRGHRVDRIRGVQASAAPDFEHGDVDGGRPERVEGHGGGRLEKARRRWQCHRGMLNLDGGLVERFRRDRHAIDGDPFLDVDQVR